MNYNPLVSVVIPVFRGEPYLKEAIDSCLAQTYKNIEIIVVNDGSDDGGMTERIALSYGDKIRYFSKENGGASSALNYGIEKMRGDWFAWLSHDDLFLPEKTEKQISAVSSLDNKVCAVRCTTAAIDEKGNSVFRPQKKIEGCFSSEKMMKLHSLKEVGLYGCTLLIHRDILKKCGGFDESLRAVQDEDFWNKMMYSGFSFVSLPDVLVKNRVHRGQATNRYRDLFEREHYEMCGHAARLFRDNPDDTEKLTRILAYKQCKERRKKGAALLKATLREVSGFNFIRELGFVFYTAWGAVYSFGKSMYRRIVLRRHRKAD